MLVLMVRRPDYARLFARDIAPKQGVFAHIRFLQPIVRRLGQRSGSFGEPLEAVLVMGKYMVNKRSVGRRLPFSSPRH